MLHWPKTAYYKNPIALLPGSAGELTLSPSYLRSSLVKKTKQNKNVGLLRLTEGSLDDALKAECKGGAKNSLQGRANDSWNMLQYLKAQP